MIQKRKVLDQVQMTSAESSIPEDSAQLEHRGNAGQRSRRPSRTLSVPSNEQNVSFDLESTLPVQYEKVVYGPASGYHLRWLQLCRLRL